MQALFVLPVAETNVTLCRGMVTSFACGAE